MFGRIFLPALIAGIVAGLLITLLQAVTTMPLIRAAEMYQSAPVHTHEGDASPAHVHEEEGAPPIFFTFAANVIAGIGYAMLLAGCLALHGRPVDARRGLLWGAAGFAVFVLAPSLGLPPQSPGMMSSELGARQAWWVCAAAAAALGIWLAVFARFRMAGLLGIVVALVPHLVGAPQPADMGRAVPPELAARFAATVIVVGAIFWAVLGWLLGALYARFQAAGPVDPPSNDPNRDGGAAPCPSRPSLSNP